MSKSRLSLNPVASGRSPGKIPKQAKRVDKEKDPFLVRIGEGEYISLFNALVDSSELILARVYPDRLPRLERLQDLPEVVAFYSDLANHCRKLDDVEGYTLCNQIACLMKKLEYPCKALDRAAEEKAMEKWIAAEQGCKEMNAKLWEIKQHPLTHSHPELSALISTLSADIRQLLGDFPPDLGEVIGHGKFGPGSTSTHSYAEGAPIFKVAPADNNTHGFYPDMREEVGWLTENTMLSYVFSSPNNGEVITEKGGCIYQLREIEEAALSDNLEFRLVETDHATLRFVPKSVSEKRIIEVGPSLAGFLQQMYDAVLRRRLKESWGLDLTDQVPNQHLAFLGSLRSGGDTPCTIDLSSASDSISYGLVAMLLPVSWTRTLARYRAKRVAVENSAELRTVEKFSAMGNAYTFSLMTLIFGAVVRSVLRDLGFERAKWRVYGDDIIVPYDAYDSVVERLSLLGFSVNEAKSFKDGAFKESCGADFFRGHNVRALYIKKPLSTVADVYKVLNLMNQCGSVLPIPAHVYRGALAILFSWIPKGLRLFGNVRTCGEMEAIWSPDDGFLPRGKILVRSAWRMPRRSQDWAYLERLYTGGAVFNDSGALDRIGVRHSNDCDGDDDSVKSYLKFGRLPEWGRRYHNRSIAFDLRLADH